MAKKITSLYINDKSIRLMVTNGRRISKLAEVPLDMDLEDVSDEEKERELVNKIKHLFAANKISPNKFIFGMSGLHSLSRPVILPLLPKTLQEEAMTREAKRLLPVPPEQLHISWQIVSSDEDHMRAFIVAMPRQTTDYLLRVLEQAGLKPNLMDIKPLALSRLIKDQTAIMIDVQENEFDIVILCDGFPQPMRTVSFPNDSLSYEEKLSIVKDELKRTVQFYNSNNPESMLLQDITVYISGEIAENPDSFESISQELGYPIAPLASPLKCPKQLDPSHYLVNVGLTLKEMPRESGALLANINTLPGTYITKPISRDRLLAIPASIAAVAVVVAFIFVIQNTVENIEATSEKIDANEFIIAKKQADRDTYMENIEVLSSQISSLEAYNVNFTAAYNTLTVLSHDMNQNVNAVVENILDGLEFESITAGEGIITVSGLTLSEVEVLEYAHAVEETGLFAEVIIERISEGTSEGDEPEKQNYVLTLKLEGSE